MIQVALLHQMLEEYIIETEKKKKNVLAYAKYLSKSNICKPFAVYFSSINDSMHITATLQSKIRIKLRQYKYVILI